RWQFMRSTRGRDGQRSVLVIRKDAYFDQVITDYPAVDQPYQLEQDLDQLPDVLKALGDAEALSTLGKVAESRGQYQLAASSLRSSLDLRRAAGDAKGQAFDLAALGLVELRQSRFDEAEGY